MGRKLRKADKQSYPSFKYAVSKYRNSMNASTEASKSAPVTGVQLNISGIQKEVIEQVDIAP